jgi:hypothetical protein
LDRSLIGASRSKTPLKKLFRSLSSSARADDDRERLL